MLYPKLEELVPHTPPMLLLDEIVETSKSAITCKLNLRSDSTFVRQGRVRAVIALEYMAQCAAAYAGYQQYLDGKRSQMGYLVSVRDAVFETGYLYVGDELLVRADHRWGNETTANFQCEVARSGLAIAHATLSAFQPSLGHE